MTLNNESRAQELGTPLKNIRYYFTRENGSRIDEGVAQNLLLITDGYANDPKDLNALSYLKNKNIAITVIGVGSDIKKTELLEIAGSPERVLIETFEGLKLNTTIKEVLHLLCKEPQIPPVPGK